MLQGEDKDPGKCHVLGTYVFSGVSHNAEGLAKVEIEYGYDESGIITASARDIATDSQLPLKIEELPSDFSWLDTLHSAKLESLIRHR